MLTNDVVSFEQLGPGIYATAAKHFVKFFIIRFYPITLEGRRGATDDLHVATIPFPPVLFTAALLELAKSIPVQFKSSLYSLMSA